MSEYKPLVLNYLAPPAAKPLGPVLACHAASAAPKSLLPCGVQTISLKEATFDSEHQPTTRVATESIASSQPKGHAPLAIKFAMTAPAEGGAMPGKKITLTCNGVGPCGSARHSTWLVLGEAKGVKHTQVIFSDKSAAAVLKEAMTKARGAAATKIGQGPLSPMGAATAKSFFTVGSYGAEIAARGLGLDLVFDAIYRAGFSRRSLAFSVVTCGNLATSTAISGKVNVTVYPSEKYKIELGFPFVKKSYGGSSRKQTDSWSDGRSTTKAKGFGSEEETPSFKLTVDNQANATSVDFTKYILYARQAEALTETVAKVIKSTPAMGFWVEGGLKLLSGALSLEWQWQEDDARSVKFYWKLAGELTLVEVSLSMNYGVKVLTREVKVQLKLTGTAKIKSSVSSQGLESPTAKGGVLRIPAEGGIEAALTLSGDLAVIAVSAGIKSQLVVDGALRIDFGKSAGGGIGLDVAEVYVDKLVAKVSVKVEKVWEYNREVTVVDGKAVLFKGIASG